jgi:hypothetical protein
MTRPIRCINYPLFKYRHVSITEDENRFVVRILTLLPKLDTNYQINCNSNDILSTNILLNRVLELNGNKFKVIGEGIFDKAKRLHKLWWKPMANIQFVIDPVIFNATGKINVISKRECSQDNGEKSPDWADRHGYTCLAQLYVRSSNDSVIDVAKSFPIHPEGSLYTNMDQSRFVNKYPEDMKDELNRSRFVGLDFNLVLPKVVKPNTLFDCFVEIYRGNTPEIATECDGDYWLVDSSAGYIPNRKIKVNKGKFSFKCSSLMLNSGDIIEIYLKDLIGHICAKHSIEVSE